MITTNRAIPSDFFEFKSDYKEMNEKILQSYNYDSKTDNEFFIEIDPISIIILKHVTKDQYDMACKKNILVFEIPNYLIDFA